VQPAATPLQPESLLNPQLVVCAGTLFAVLPVLELKAYRSDDLNNPLTSRAARDNIHRSWQEIISEHQNIYRAGLRFRIFNLLEVPKTPEALESYESMCSVAEFNQRDYYAEMPADMDLPAGPLPGQRISPSQLWFSCTAKDGKIWMAASKQLISYDVQRNCWDSKPLLDPRLTEKEHVFPHAYLHNEFPMELNFTAIP
jgi:hypothetical protein